MTKRSPLPGIETAPSNGPAGPPAHCPERLAWARWQTAEAGLYPLILTDPDLYEAAVTLMSEARDVLRSECDTVSGLAEIEPAGVLARCPSASATTARGVDPETVVDAARALRGRELTVLQPAGDQVGPTVEAHP
jgi:hypothetical protein